MPRKSSSQWDFGELFTPPANPPPDVTEPSSKPATEPEPSAAPKKRVLSVTELTLGIKRELEDGFASVLVSGEVSNFRQQASGHAYFVLKDANAQLSCVLFRGQGGADRVLLRDGAHVTLGGDVTVYEPRGQYQLRVTSVRLEGVGALQAAFERLKAKLSAEGLFDSARKRPLPQFPRRVGLVTSPTGAAIRDVLSVVARRYAGLEFVLVPVRVQGAGAAAEIAAAVALLNEWAGEQGRKGAGEKGSRGEREVPPEDISSAPLHPCSPAPALDAILVTRGGGSLEDLWAFNEEVVARAIAASEIPVVSAVGHEIDFTIADFVADLRAATPSAAAELLTAGYVASTEFVHEAVARLGQLTRQRLGWAKDEAAELARRLGRVHPRRRLETWEQHLDDLSSSLLRSVRAQLKSRSLVSASLRQRLTTRQPVAVLARHRREVEQLTARLPALALGRLRTERARLEKLEQSLRLLSPQAVLERGYSITTDAVSGQVVRDPAAVKTGQRLRTRVGLGELESIAVPVKRG